ncbi:MAG: sugar phosphate isomerase/epimerase [Chitinophagaceae bacterium]|nr:MAG: sugar phosphate isomerase/epimerase [Chitinophagaceae bacterium]
MERRRFLKSMAVSTAGVALGSNLFAAPQKRPLGVQLWTVRAYLNDLKGSLARLAKLGYNELEVFDYDGRFYGKTPGEFQKICKDLGFTIVSSHYMTGRHNPQLPGSLLNGWEKAVEDAASIDIKYMVCAWLYKEERVSLDKYKELAAMLNKAGETCKTAGIQLAYHSHNFEFPPIDGIVPYDFILENTDKDLMKMQADLYWITKAGADPVAYFNKYPGRFPLWHVKDMERGSEHFAEVGKGVIDFDRIFAAREVAGLKHWFVEQDQTNREPFESLKISRDFILTKKW